MTPVLLLLFGCLAAKIGVVHPVQAAESYFWRKFPSGPWAMGDAVLAYKAQSDSSGIASYPFWVNAQTGIIGCARYVANAFCPMDLNVCYFHPVFWPFVSYAVLFFCCWR